MNHHSKLWLSALATFGVGDLGTTYIGLSMDGVRETHDVANVFLQSGGFEYLIAAKIVVLVTTLAMWAMSDEDWTVAVPLTLTLWGVGITSWNTYVILVAL